MRRLRDFAGLIILILCSVALANAENAGVVMLPGTTEVGWKEVAYGAWAVSGYFVVRYTKSIDKKQDKIFTCYENHEGRLSHLEGAHAANHGVVNRRSEGE